MDSICAFYVGSEMIFSYVWCTLLMLVVVHSCKESHITGSSINYVGSNWQF